ncbi:hypothetical protein H257_08851 [Aphanomyces astaci]|uniref:Uncharacterized protein n=1 Tax=Aphanomyces astaci TaxID=112090 RepID=W4GED4_APHAT|nr:hypothetical protein H257_08851 [Aphanomyces astaci]ETV77434.1 hypothetical protein H257_08851 [Aphanomyces astaci]|eukprot:XP_009833221.1 hypothetical protein H257_08851 [Aphanomyces astaci]
MHPQCPEAIALTQHLLHATQAIIPKAWLPYQDIYLPGHCTASASTYTGLTRPQWQTRSRNPSPNSDHSMIPIYPKCCVLVHMHRLLRTFLPGDTRTRCHPTPLGIYPMSAAVWLTTPLALPHSPTLDTPSCTPRFLARSDIAPTAPYPAPYEPPLVDRCGPPSLLHHLVAPPIHGNTDSHCPPHTGLLLVRCSRRLPGTYASRQPSDCIAPYHSLGPAHPTQFYSIYHISTTLWSKLSTSNHFPIHIGFLTTGTTPGLLTPTHLHWTAALRLLDAIHWLHRPHPQSSEPRLPWILTAPTHCLHWAQIDNPAYDQYVLDSSAYLEATYPTIYLTTTVWKMLTTMAQSTSDWAAALMHLHAPHFHKQWFSAQWATSADTGTPHAPPMWTTFAPPGNSPS